MSLDNEGIRERLLRVAAGEEPPYSGTGDPPGVREIRIGVTRAVQAWLGEHGRYMTATDEQIKEQIGYALRRVLSQCSGVAPAMIDIDVDAEIVRHEDGGIAYAFKYWRVLN